MILNVLIMNSMHHDNSIKWEWYCGLHSLWKKVNGWGEGRGGVSLRFAHVAGRLENILAGPPARSDLISRNEFEFLQEGQPNPSTSGDDVQFCQSFQGHCSFVVGRAA
jgi:hypothetical protein